MLETSERVKSVTVDDVPAGNGGFGRRVQAVSRKEQVRACEFLEATGWEFKCMRVLMSFRPGVALYAPLAVMLKGDRELFVRPDGRHLAVAELGDDDAAWGVSGGLNWYPKGPAGARAREIVEGRVDSGLRVAEAWHDDGFSVVAVS